MKKYIYTLLLLLAFCSLRAQNTFKLKEGQSSPKASIEDISWISGHWRGEAMGGITEEIWSPPLGGAMMGSFKLVVNDKVNFYELETISEENESLLLKIKHFDAALTGWEEKDESVDFPLVKITENAVYFDELTFELVSKDELNIYVVFKEGDEIIEAKFNYKRFR